MYVPDIFGFAGGGQSPPLPASLVSIGKSGGPNRRAINGGGVRGGDAVIGGEWPLEDPEHRTGISAILKYAILALICALAFFIRLFAVVSVQEGSSGTFSCTSIASSHAPKSRMRYPYCTDCCAVGLSRTVRAMKGRNEYRW